MARHRYRRLALIPSGLFALACGAKSAVDVWSDTGGRGGSARGGSSGAAGLGGTASGGVSGTAGLVGGALGGVSGTAGAGGAGGATPEPRCGNAVQEAGEECDDGDSIAADGCENDCTRSHVTSVVVGPLRTCALTSRGSVRCWGRNEYGAAGYGRGLCGTVPAPCTDACCVGDDETPASDGGLVDVGGSVVQLSTGVSHTCAVLDTGGVVCWGQGHDGALGYANEEDIGDDEAPATAGEVDVGDTVIEVVVGGNGGGDHTCALLVGGRVRCWGYASAGALGYADTNDIGDDESPASAGDVDLGGVATQIVAGHGFNCALLEAGNVRCWGFGARGRLGYGNTETIGDDETPSAAGDVPIGEPVTRLAAGGRHACALVRGGRVRCWGYGADGSLGYANPETVGDDETVASAGVVPLDGNAVEISAGDQHTCVVLDTGELRCWGSNIHGELGQPALTTGCALCTSGAPCCVGDDEPPSAAGAIDVGGSVAQIAVGWLHVCALLDAGGVRCWGAGQDGALGYGNTRTIGDDEPPSAAGDVAVF